MIAPPAQRDAGGAICVSRPHHTVTRRCRTEIEGGAGGARSPLRPVPNATTGRRRAERFRRSPPNHPQQHSGDADVRSSAVEHRTFPPPTPRPPAPAGRRRRIIANQEVAGSTPAGHPAPRGRAGETSREQADARSSIRQSTVQHPPRTLSAARGPKVEDQRATGVAGSIPAGHPALATEHGDCSSAVERYDPSPHPRPAENRADGARVIDSDSRGRGFESRQSQVDSNLPLRADGPLVVGYRTNASFGEMIRNRREPREPTRTLRPFARARQGSRRMIHPMAIRRSPSTDTAVIARAGRSPSVIA